MKYICNDIVKPFCVRIIRYTEIVREMHELAKYPLPTFMKGERAMSANWTVWNQELTVSEICLAIKDGLPSSMQDELEYHQEDYRSLTYEYWCDLLSKTEVKDERKRAAIQI